MTKCKYAGKGCPAHNNEWYDGCSISLFFVEPGRILEYDEHVLSPNFESVVCGREFRRGETRTYTYTWGVLDDEEFENLLVFDDDRRKEMCPVFGLLEEMEELKVTNTLGD